MGKGGYKMKHKLKEGSREHVIHYNKKNGMVCSEPECEINKKDEFHHEKIQETLELLKKYFPSLHITEKDLVLVIWNDYSEDGELLDWVEINHIYLGSLYMACLDKKIARNRIKAEIKKHYGLQDKETFEKILLSKLGLENE